MHVLLGGVPLSAEPALLSNQLPDHSALHHRPLHDHESAVAPRAAGAVRFMDLYVHRPNGSPDNRRKNSRVRPIIALHSPSHSAAGSATS